MHRDRLKRRQFITLLGGAAVAGPRALIAQPAQRKYRVGALVPFPLAALTVFVDTLRQLGFVDGQNVTVDGRGFAVSYERLPAIAAELVELKVDAIICAGDAAIIAAQAAKLAFPSSQPPTTWWGLAWCARWHIPAATRPA
jgi:putative ABC transport system substrate-binding protein